ncbi:MAG TPA: DUF3775 domain-containing protein [Stellaceae bacterium]|jgi:hypothetical protein|nr:DUF3775 domain-containing protein [Stellaceae bacterium]
MPELHISTDKIDDFIEAAREVAGKVRPTTGDRTTTGDDSSLVTIEDYPGDPRREQMREFVRGLNFGEQIDLLALILVGRGDFDIAEWSDAVREARDRIRAGDPDFMIGDAALPEYLGAALDAVEISRA